MDVKWIDSPQAKHLFESERQKLKDSLPNLQGHYLLQYSAWDEKILDKTTLEHDFFVTGSKKGGAQVDYFQLPFRDNSIDCALLHHVIDQSTNPHQSLREAARVIVPNGFVVILGINPWSTWGLTRYISAAKGPEAGRYISIGRVSDWLNLLGFRVEQIESTQFLPPFVSRLAPQLSSKADTLLNDLSLSFGGVYIMIARKLVAGRTPIRPQWTPLSGHRIPVATPSVRGMRVSNR